MITSDCGSITSELALLTVNTQPLITGQPEGATLCEGAPITFAVEAGGTEPLEYQWRRNGIAIEGANAPVLTIAETTVDNAGLYDVVVSNMCDTATSAVAELIVNEYPRFEEAPVSQTVCAGDTATFTVVANGTEPIFYQWLKDGLDIPGATQPTLTLNEVTAESAGVYSVMIFNTCGSIRGIDATLTVELPPVIDAAPVAVTVCEGENANFAVTASGAGELTYQWRKDGLDIAGANAPTLALEGVTPADAVAYDVVVSNHCGSTVSPAVNLNLNFAPTIVTAPADATVCETGTVSFSVTASGLEPFSYQWFKDGFELFGENDAILTITDASPEAAGAYTVLVSNECGETLSAAGNLTVDLLPVVVSGPESAVICRGDAIALAVVVEGADPISYQWQKNGLDIPGAMAAELVIAETSLEDAGDYQCTVFNRCGSTVSPVATITINQEPLIAQAPLSLAVCEGETATFSIDARGTAPLLLQWQKDGVDIPGANGDSLTLTDVTAADAGAYAVAITNDCGSIVSPAGELTVNLFPVVTADPISMIVCEGEAATFEVTATGTDPLAFQWRKNGVDIAGANSNVFTIPTAQFADVASYDVLVTNLCGSVTSAAATLDLDVAPTIATAPISTEICEGEGFTFSVIAEGTEPLTFQWLKDGVMIDGATADTFSIAEALAAEAGEYSVIVTNECGTATSAALLTVNVAPVLAADLLPKTACEGTNVDFVAVANGTEPFFFQWQKDGIDLPGATNSILTLEGVTPEDAGDYSVVVSNLCGEISSNSAALAIALLPVVTEAPVSLVTCENGTATFSVVATGTLPLEYQWRKNGVAIDGANAASLMLDAVDLDAAADYDVIVTNFCGSATSAAASLTVATAPVVTGQPLDAAVCEGEDVTFVVLAEGSAPFTYQWRKDGIDLVGATSDTLNLDLVAAADAGAYDVIVTNDCGFATSIAAQLDVFVAPTVVESPVSAEICKAGSVTFSVTAAGTEPFTYQWRKDGVEIAGATGATLNLDGIAVDDAATYDVVITNECGEATSDLAELIVNTAPFRIEAPVSQSLCEGSPVTFTVFADSSTTLLYQWRFNGVAIDGATGTELTLDSISTEDAGLYDVVLSNDCGEVVTEAATLTVFTAPSILAEPVGVTECEGSTISLAVTADGVEPLTFQWRKDGEDIAGANNNTLTIDTLTIADAGAYDVVITNECGSVQSAAADVVVELFPTLILDAAGQTVCEGEPVTLSVIAGGTAPFAFQWRKDGIAIDGATNSTFDIAAATPADAGDYDVVVTNDCGLVQSSVAIVTIDLAPAVTLDPISQTVCEGGEVTFSIAADGTAPFTYQWRKDGIAIDGANDASLTLFALTAADAGSYDVEVSNLCGISFSAPAELSVTLAPSVLFDPTDSIVCEGETATFSVTAVGSGELSYQWRKDGLDIDGAIDAELSLATITLDDAGEYDVVVTSECGSAFSGVATLDVAVAPVIADQPVSLRACTGEAFSLSVVADSLLPLSYQWQKGGVAIDGATSATFTVDAATIDDAGAYTVTITNDCGTAVSKIATVLLTPAPELTASPIGGFVNLGESFTFDAMASGASLKYQWRKDGVEIDGANGSSLTIASATAADQGDYDVVIFNDCGSVTSDVAVLTVASFELDVTFTGCHTEGVTTLTWSSDVDFDEVFLNRDGASIATLAGGVATFEDAITEPGAYTYSLMALTVDGDLTVPFEITVFVLVAPSELACPADNQSISWTNNDVYDAIVIFRDGEEIAVLPGDTNSFQDTAATPGDYEYRVEARRASAGCESTVSVTCTGTVAPVDRFVRGDANGDSRVDISDVLFMLSFVFTEGKSPDCMDAADFNNDGEVDFLDAIGNMNYLFQAGPGPVGGSECAADPEGDADGLGCTIAPESCN